MRILILPGDGIGPEICRVTRLALETLNEHFDLKLDLIQRHIGLAALKEHGSTLPSDVLELARSVEGVILGPVSTIEYPPPAEGGVNPSATIRKQLDLYANIRPSHTRAGVPAKAGAMDLVIARENTEGFYADRSMYAGSGELQPTEDLAIALRKVSAYGCRRIAEVAFELAQRRRKVLTMVHKANVFKVTDGLFRREVLKAAERFPDVKLDEALVDAMAALLVRKPEAFDVIVTTNMYGDILSDEASELAGGLGLGASINVGDEHVIAQAAHGSAPDIAGKNIANPTALMLSVAMLLDWLGAHRQRQDLIAAAKHFGDAVDACLVDPAHHTPDLGGRASTETFGEAVANAIVQRPLVAAP